MVGLAYVLLAGSMLVRCSNTEWEVVARVGGLANVVILVDLVAVILHAAVVC